MAVTKFSLKLPEFNKGGEGSKSRLYILLGILAVLSVVAVVVNFWLVVPDEPEPPPSGLAGELNPGDLNQEIAQLLPQLERQDDETIEVEEGAITWEEIDPFALPMELMGVVTGGKKDLAIIKARQTTYIASKGERIAGSWELVEINRHSVRLKSDTEEILIELGSRD